MGLPDLRYLSLKGIYLALFGQNSRFYVSQVVPPDLSLVPDRSLPNKGPITPASDVALLALPAFAHWLLPFAL